MAINYFNRIEPAQKVQKACQEHGVKAVVIKAVSLLVYLGRVGVRSGIGGLSWKLGSDEEGEEVGSKQEHVLMGDRI